MRSICGCGSSLMSTDAAFDAVTFTVLAEAWYPSRNAVT
jgi:hypothetical protein